MAFGGRKRTHLATSPVSVARTLTPSQAASGPLALWAPPYGPVRPLLQLLCILPPRRWGGVGGWGVEGCVEGCKYQPELNQTKRDGGGG